MKREIALIAGPLDWQDNRKSWLSRVPDKIERLTQAKLSMRIIKAAWHNEISENHWAAIEIRKAVAIIEYQRELAAIEERHKTLMLRLSVLDEDFHQPTISQMFGDLMQLRRSNRT